MSQSCPSCASTLTVQGDCLHCLVSLAATPPPGLSASLGSFASYDILEKISSGGMGEVYLAHQPELNRTVALKMLSGSATQSPDALRRFQTEIEATASLDHPHIVPIFETGLVDDLAFYSMPYLSGGTLADALQKENRNPQDSIRILQKVARAVSYAHRRGILHRDLKPSNILLDEHGEPQVADFGLAKLSKQDTVLTLTGSVLGTPAYMSPEQASGNQTQISTSSDIYSLGAILYELLTGRPPFQADTPLEMLKRVTEDSPPPPSTLVKKIPSDLSTITLKCLEKDPTRRYQTADDLADDLDRFIQGRPILAKPPNTSYLVARFLRRHAFASCAIAAILLSLLAGTIISTSLYLQQKQTLAKANAESAIRTEIAAFLSDTLSAAGSSQSLGRDSTMMQEVLDKTAARLDKEVLHPLVEVELRTIIGKTYQDLTQQEASERHLKRALTLRRQLTDQDNHKLLLADALTEYANALMRADRMREGLKHVAEAITILEPFGRQQEVRLGRALAIQGRMQSLTKKHQEALKSGKRAYEIWLRHPHEPALNRATDAYIIALRKNNRREEANSIFREYLRFLRKTLPSKHPELSVTLSNFGMNLMDLEEYEEAKKILPEALAISREVFGDRSPNEDHILARLAILARRQGDLAQELDYAYQAAEASRRSFPEGHRYRKEGFRALSNTLLRQAADLLESGQPDCLTKVDDLFQQLHTFADSQNDSPVRGPYLDGLSAYADHLRGKPDALTNLQSALTAQQKLPQGKHKNRSHTERLQKFLKEPEAPSTN